MHPRETPLYTQSQGAPPVVKGARKNAGVERQSCSKPSVQCPLWPVLLNVSKIGISFHFYAHTAQSAIIPAPPFATTLVHMLQERLHPTRRVCIYPTPYNHQNRYFYSIPHPKGYIYLPESYEKQTETIDFSIAPSSTLTKKYKRMIFFYCAIFDFDQ